MPVVTTKVNIPLDDSKKAALTAAIKKSCHARLGKGEDWVMTIFEQDADMYFRGTKDPVAFVNVQISGPVLSSPATLMTQDITAAVSQTTGITGTRIYICYYGAQSFGWNGNNFA